MQYDTETVIVSKLKEQLAQLVEAGKIPANLDDFHEDQIQITVEDKRNRKKYVWRAVGQYLWVGVLMISGLLITIALFAGQLAIMGILICIAALALVTLLAINDNDQS